MAVCRKMFLLFSTSRQKLEPVFPPTPSKTLVTPTKRNDVTSKSSVIVTNVCVRYNLYRSHIKCYERNVSFKDAVGCFDYIAAVVGSDRWLNISSGGWWNDQDRVKLKNLEKHCPIAILSTRNLTWDPDKMLPCALYNDTVELLCLYSFPLWLGLRRFLVSA
jgi:hypothetical protein